MIYLPDFKLDKSWRGYCRLKKTRGSFKAVTKPRPSKLIIRKMILNEIYFSLIAMNEKDEIMDIRTTPNLDYIYEWAQKIYGVERNNWIF